MDTVHKCDRQTDRQTDGQTDRITITDTVQTASHGKKRDYAVSYRIVSYHDVSHWHSRFSLSRVGGYKMNGSLLTLHGARGG